MTIARVTAQWTGFSGAPGYTNLYYEMAGSSDEQVSAPARVRTAFSALLQQLPAGVTVTVSPTIEYVDETTGVLQDYAEAPEAPDPVNGSGSGTYSAPTGAVVNWLTSTIRAGRRVRGRTFIVPLSGGAFQADGTLGTQGLSVMDNFASNARNDESGGSLVVWSRPTNGAGGVAAPVTGHRVPDMAAVLRSRRD